MFVRVALLFALMVSSFSAAAFGGDWIQFRGPGGLGVSDDKGVPAKWSSTDNIAWKVELPGPGASSPIVVGNRVFLTCYTGYGLEPTKGDPKELRRHLLCFDRGTGKELWKKTFEPKLPEHKYEGKARTTATPPARRSATASDCMSSSENRASSASISPVNNSGKPASATGPTAGVRDARQCCSRNCCWSTRASRAARWSRSTS